jgi:hypothetical protein
MSDIANFAQRAFATFGALALTMTLLVSSFATPQATGFAGMLV